MAVRRSEYTPINSYMFANAVRSTLLPARSASALALRSPVSTQPSCAIARRALSTSGASARPMSPHLTIYRFPFNAVTSVGFRASGILLTVGLAGVGIGMTVASRPLEYYVNMLKCSPALTYVAKLSVALPLSYHYIGGIRHLTWDWVIGHNPETIRKTGLVLVGGSVLFSVLAASLELEPARK